MKSWLQACSFSSSECVAIENIDQDELDGVQKPSSRAVSLKMLFSGAAGGLGTLGIQYAKSMGMRVIAVDHPSKKDHCIQLGAEYFVDGFSETMADEINKVWGSRVESNMRLPAH